MASEDRPVTFDGHDVEQMIHQELVDTMEQILDRNCLACGLHAMVEALQGFGEDKRTAAKLTAFMIRELPSKHWCGTCGHRVLGIPRPEADLGRIRRELARRRTA